jgi:hypothetical protein
MGGPSGAFETAHGNGWVRESHARRQCSTGKFLDVIRVEEGGGARPAGSGGHVAQRVVTC